MEDCKQGFHCATSRVCKKVAKDGDPCSNSLECDYGMYCDGDHKCKRMYTAREGQACRTSPECQDGLLCLDEKCTAFAEHGTSCAHSTDCPTIYHICDCHQRCQLGDGEYLLCIGEWRAFSYCSLHHECALGIIDTDDGSCVARNCAPETFSLASCILRHTPNQQCVQQYEHAIMHQLQLDAKPLTSRHHSHQGMSDGARVGITLAVLVPIVCCTALCLGGAVAMWLGLHGHGLYTIRRRFGHPRMPDIMLHEMYTDEDEELREVAHHDTLNSQRSSTNLGAVST